ncbi:MAG: hypothetical protein K2Y18_07640 [Alphaproteobacteria bacterium]|nr:hypothetical protein [Alphaproteobacteria bacterium]
MKRFFFGFFMVSLFSTDATCLIKVGDLLDPTTECGLDFEKYQECLKIEEETTVSAERKARAFCYAIKNYAEKTENIKKKNESIQKLKSIDSRKLEQIKSDVKKLDEARKPFRDELLKANITPQQLGKIPTRSIVNKELFIQCPAVDSKGNHYLGTKIREGVIDPKSSCGLNLAKLQECIEHDRGQEGQGESFCNDIKLYAGNKYKLLELKDLPEGKFKQQMLAGVLETQKDLEWRFVKKEELLTEDKLKNIDPLGDMEKFTCSGKLDLKGSVEDKRKINARFQDTIGIIDLKRTCGLNLSKLKACDASQDAELKAFCEDVKEYANTKVFLQKWKTKRETAIGQIKTDLSVSINKLEDSQKKLLEKFKAAGLTPEQAENIPAAETPTLADLQCKPVLGMRSSQRRSELGSSMKRALN